MHNHVGEHAMKNQQNKRRINHTGEDSTTQEETQRHRRRLGNTATASREIGPIHRSTPSLPGTLLAEPKSSRMSVSSCSIGFSAVHRRRLSKTREESVTQEKTQQHKRRPSGTGEDSATQPRPARRSDQSIEVLNLSRSLSSQKPKTETAVRRKAANIASRLTET